MGDLFRDGAVWMAAQFQAHLSRSVVYSRGEDSVTFNATIGQTDREKADDFGRLVKATTRDYIFLTASLVLASAQTLPEPGDQIRETLDGAVRVFELLSVTGSAVWRYADQYGILLRVNTRHVATE